MRPVLFIVGAALWSAALHAQTVPTPESVLGHKPGDDFYLANYDESREYFHKLAAASNRIKLITVGKTTRGLDWEIAIISSPKNLAQLDKYKDISRRLAHGRGLTDEARTRSPAKAKRSCTSMAACTPPKSPARSNPSRSPTSWSRRRAIPKSTPSSTTSSSCCGPR